MIPLTFEGIDSKPIKQDDVRRFHYVYTRLLEIEWECDQRWEKKLFRLSVAEGLKGRSDKYSEKPKLKVA